MDVLLQSHGSKRVFPLPEGLKELTSDIIREVLRHQPECIHTFIAEYLETMVIVREKARDSAVVVSNILKQGYFFDDLYRTKNVTREKVEAYTTVLQAGWRGYIVRKKFRMYLQKKRKLQEERERKKNSKIEQYLDSIGITYDEATRAACIIQAAYRQSREGKCIINDLGEVWMEGEGIPVSQRIREADISRGRYDRCEKKDWGDFFEMDQEGEIHYEWPRVGQLVKIPRDLLTADMEIVRFYGMRDHEGKEQYSYLKGPQKGRNPRGCPIGFLIPLSRELLQEDSVEIIFLKNENNERMGKYTFVYEKAVEKQDLNYFANALNERNKITGNLIEDVKEEFDYDPDWVLPRILIQIRKDCIQETDDEITFVREGKPEVDENYTFRAEKPDLSLKVINRILNSDCSNVEEAMAEASNIPTYRQMKVGRFLAVEKFQIPKYIQKVVIQKETKRAEYENREMDKFEYVFLPRKFKWPKNKAIIVENPIKIPIVRFHGHHSYYRGSTGLNKDNIFVMGPMMCSPDGEPFTYTSIFWDCFGPESWYQLLCNISNRKIRQLGEAAEEIEEEEEEEEEQEQEQEEEEEQEQEQEQEQEEEQEQEQEEQEEQEQERQEEQRAVDEFEGEQKEEEVLKEEKDDEKEKEGSLKETKAEMPEIRAEDQTDEEEERQLKQEEETLQPAATMEEVAEELATEEAKEPKEEGTSQIEPEASAE